MHLAQDIGTTSPLDLLAAKLQSEAGQFLQLRSILLRLQGMAQTVDQSQQIQQLLVTQMELENQLPTVVAQMGAVRAGGLTVIAGLTIAPFVVQMEMQISAVSSLQTQMGVSGTTGGSVLTRLMAIPHFWWYVGGGLLLWKIVK